MRRYFLDTGPMVDHLVLRYAAEVSFSDYESVAPAAGSHLVAGLTTVEIRRAFLKLLRRHQLGTIHGVLVEVGYHISLVERLNNKPFWNMTASFYEETMHEHSIRLPGNRSRKYPCHRDRRCRARARLQAGERRPDLERPPRDPAVCE